MAKREKYRKAIKCPQCSNVGVVIYEENQNPMHHGGELNTKIISLPKGFCNKGLKITCGCGEILPEE